MLAAVGDETFLTSCGGMPKELPAGVKGSFTLLGDLYAGSDSANAKRQFLASTRPTVARLVADGVVKAMPVEVIGGLDAVQAGFERMAAGDYSFTKLVAKVA